jgi:hypothetical protein
MSTNQDRFLFSLFVMILLFNYSLKAQDSSCKVEMPIYISGSFCYDFPQSFGASGGVNFPIKSKVIIAQGKDGEEKSYRDKILATDLGFYRYPFNNSGLYFFQSIGIRYHKNKPYYFEWLISAGVLRTFYDGIVYSVDANGAVHEKNNFGRYYAVTGFSTVFGHDFERSKSPKPFSIDIKPFVWVQYPYNSFILPHLSAWFTFIYHFNNFNIFIRQKAIEQKENK